MRQINDIENCNYMVIIVGGNHHNGLGLARIFGINGIKVHAIVIDNHKRSFLNLSKYVASCKNFKSEKDAYDYILNNFKDRSKYCIIPYSDGAALELDSRLNEFNGFVTPSINKKQGAIAKMMEKSKQYDFANQNGIKMAFTQKINFDDLINFSWQEKMFPCIIKPVISAEGDKKDITICQNQSDLNLAIETYKSKGYKRALVQEYLKIDYEIDVFGCVLKNSICMIPTETIRSWPKEGGTNSFSKIITDKKIISDCRQVVEKLKKAGFYGLYDIELFMINGNVYLNEINYRNSGDVYMGIAQEYYYPLAWFYENFGMQYVIEETPKYSTFAMTECADVRNVLKKNINYKNWKIDYKKTNDYALKFKGDMLPAYNRYFYYLRQFMKFKKY